jgi:hypothetical protein
MASARLPRELGAGLMGLAVPLGGKPRKTGGLPPSATSGTAVS